MTYLDTRDLDSELTELIDRDNDYNEAVEDGEDVTDYEPLTEAEQERKSALESLQDEIGSEWTYGATMIPVDDFEDYARELAEDTGAISDNANWPANCIDWEKAADELSQDFTEIDFDGESYYVRL